MLKPEDEDHAKHTNENEDEGADDRRHFRFSPSGSALLLSVLEGFGGGASGGPPLAHSSGRTTGLRSALWPAFFFSWRDDT